MGVARPKLLRRLVQIAHQTTCVSTRHAFVSVNFDSFHPGEIDDHTAIAYPVSGGAMASGTHRQGQTLFLGKIKSSHDVGRADAVHDQRRMPIVCPIVDQAR